MKHYIKILLLSGLLMATFIKGVRVDDDKDMEDRFMIFIKHSYEGKTPEFKKYINDITMKINNLIVDNRSTYKNQAKLNEMEERYNKDDPYLDYGNFPFTYPISSIGDTTVLFAYLTPELVEKVEAIKEVTAVERDKKVSIHANSFGSSIQSKKGNNFNIKENF